MAMSRVGVVRTKANDPVIGTLLAAFWGAPLFAAFMIGTPSLLKARPAVANHMVQAVEDTPANKPILSRVIVRPAARRTEDIRQERSATTSPEMEMAIAFAPPERIARTPAAPARGDNMPTGTTPLQHGLGVASGLRVVADGASYQLAGVEPMAPGAVCRRLDGVEEPCAQRAADRLELLTRGRTVRCERIETAADGTARGYCLAGKINLADDLVKNGLARRV